MDLVINDTVPTQFYCNCSRERVSKALIAVAENVVIGQNAVVGEMPHDGEKGVATIGSGIHIGERAKVGPNAMVNANVKDGEEEW